MFVLIKINLWNIKVQTAVETFSSDVLMKKSELIQRLCVCVCVCVCVCERDLSCCVGMLAFCML